MGWCFFFVLFIGKSSYSILVSAQSESTKLILLLRIHWYHFVDSDLQILAENDSFWQETLLISGGRIWDSVYVIRKLIGQLNMKFCLVMFHPKGRKVDWVTPCEPTTFWLCVGMALWRSFSLLAAFNVQAVPYHGAWWPLLRSAEHVDFDEFAGIKISELWVSWRKPHFSGENISTRVPF